MFGMRYTLPMHLIPFILALSAAPAVPAPSVPLSTRVHDVETGLLPPVRVVNRPGERMDLQAEMRNHQVPAVSIAVIHDRHLEWARAYGVVSEGGARATTETLFQAASISKSVTTMAVLRLVEAGELSLDAPIGSELKTWTLAQGKATESNPVTLRKLLSHTAGTNVHGFSGYAAGSPVPTLAQVLDGAKPANSPAVVVDQAPDQSFRYSGGGFCIVQQAVLDATGVPFPTFLAHTVLEPLGMSHSTFEQPLPATRTAGAAMPVDEHGKPIAGGPHIYPEMAAAGLWTTPTDLAKWLIEIQGSLDGHANHVLSAAMTRTMLTPVKNRYGLGIEVSAVDSVLRFSHGGSNAGYRAQYFADSRGNGAVIMTSGDGGGILIGELLRGIAAAYGWSGFGQTERTAADIPLAKQRAYLGSFASGDGFRFTVSDGADRLLIRFSDGTVGPFYPSGEQSFFATRSTLQVHFDSPEGGELIFAPDDKVAFRRVP